LQRKQTSGKLIENKLLVVYTANKLLVLYIENNLLVICNENRHLVKVTLNTNPAPIMHTGADKTRKANKNNQNHILTPQNTAKLLAESLKVVTV
jgi:hypothetical protein